MKIQEGGLIYDDTDPRCQYIHADGGLTGEITCPSVRYDFGFITVIDSKTGMGKRYCGLVNRESTIETTIRVIMRNGGKWPPVFNRAIPWPDNLEPYE